MALGILVFFWKGIVSKRSPTLELVVVDVDARVDHVRERAFAGRFMIHVVRVVGSAVRDGAKTPRSSFLRDEIPINLEARGLNDHNRLNGKDLQCQTHSQGRGAVHTSSL